MIARLNLPVEIEDRTGERPLPAGLESSALEALLERARVRHVPAGALLFREGEEADGIVVVRAGAGEVYRSGYGRTRERVGEFAAGDVLAIASTLTDQRHLASARALVPTEILRISRRDVRRLCRHRP